MDHRDIILNIALPIGSAVWDSNGTVHWAVGERAVPNNRGDPDGVGCLRHSSTGFATP